MQVTIISGFTGCGKTTQIPQFIMDDCVSKRERFNIVVTQPRRIAAKTVATRVCKERNWPLGRLVGYKIGLDKENTSSDTRLMFCTTGVLKKMVISKKHLHDWTHVILDEVHEREEDMDFLLLLCKKLLHSNSRGVKLILMSATISVEKLSDYFTVYHSDIGSNYMKNQLITNIALIIDLQSQFYPVGRRFPRFGGSRSLSSTRRSFRIFCLR